MIVLRSLISIAILPGLVAVVLPWLIVRPVSWPTGVALVGLVPLVLGLGLSAWCVTLFATRGRGTPAPWDAPRRFVALGPYRLVRNPMYLGMGSVVLGEAVLFASWLLALYLIVLLLVWHAFVVLWEEPSLERTFGEEYRSYRGAVPRWLPRFP
jgi:protein-S-isoprenylcysteine O-methyltransferase Ste14